jgi:hypothetical protein
MYFTCEINFIKKLWYFTIIIKEITLRFLDFFGTNVMIINLKLQNIQKKYTIN